MAHSKRMFLALTALLAFSNSAFAVDMIGNCELSGAKGSIPIATPAKAGQLTVQTSLPSPIWWNGDTPEAIQDGMEYCMAAEIAWRAGYDKLEVVNVGWDPLVAGQTSGYDLTLAQVSITEDRKKVVDFSIPYFNSDIGVITRADAPVDATTIKTAKVGLQQATTGASFATDKLSLTNVQMYPELGDMFTALRAGQIDAAMTDSSIALVEQLNTEGKSVVVGQYKTGEVYGAIYEKGSANSATIDKIIQSMIDDGTIAKLAGKYLAAAWGKDPATIPYFE
jgi:polar amino acid transport system substrate-binding protein